MNVKYSWIVILGVVLAVPAYAARIRPTQTEWFAWPPYCKARYLSTDIRADYMRQSFSPSEVEKWQSIVGQQTMTNIHHGCRGILHLGRAERIASNKNDIRYKHELKEAFEELKYSLLRTPAGHPVHSEMRAYIARVKYGLGEKSAAIGELRDLVRDEPELPMGYSTLAAYLYREKDYAGARETLERGIDKVAEPTAEMHYFLGLVLVKQNAWTEAREHAVQAYDLGYPLPGLRRKLKSAGHWTE